MVMFDKVRRIAPQFDILHFHIDQFHLLAWTRTYPCEDVDPSFERRGARLITGNGRS
jgi:hypothetical protein